MGASIAIDGQIGCERRSLGIARAVAFENLAIASCLSCREVGAVRRIRHPAHVAVACACFAKIVRAWALARRRAPDALARSVANHRAAARNVEGLGRIRRHAIGADIPRAQITIDRQVGIVGQARRTHVAIAHDFAAITRSLQNRARECVRSLIGNLTRIVDASAFFAFRFGDVDAMVGDEAFDAQAITVADRGATYAARCALRHVGVTRHARSTDVVRTRILVVVYVTVIDDFRIDAIFTNMNFAVTDGLRHPGRGHSVDVRIDALTRRGIAQVVGARIAIVAIGVLRAGDFANSAHARTHAHIERAGRPLGENLIDGRAGDARIGRAGIVVIGDVLRIVFRGRRSPNTGQSLAIKCSLRRVRSHSVGLRDVFTEKRHGIARIGRTGIRVVASRVDLAWSAIDRRVSIRIRMIAVQNRDTINARQEQAGP